MDPGWAGALLTVTFKVPGLLEPHALLPTTEIVPPPAPGVAVIDAVVEVPLHPVGRVQVYETAPGIGVML